MTIIAKSSAGTNRRAGMATLVFFLLPRPGPSREEVKLDDVHAGQIPIVVST
jgi:hypothetical protein